MKKFYSIAMMAMMALCAAVTTVSCTNNDDDAHALNTQVKLTATINSDAYSFNCEDVMLNALKRFYQGKIGSTGSVDYVKMDDADVMNFTTTKANVEALKQALKNITSNETDAVVNRYNLTWIDLRVTDGFNEVISYNYRAQKKDEPKAEEKKEETKKVKVYYPIEAATWTGTINDVKYTVELTSVKVSDNEYKATLHIGDEVIPGKAYSTDGVGFAFSSDEKASSITLYSLIVTYDSDAKAMKGYILYTLLPVGTGEFTKK